jgi:hypothetical protein
MKKVFWCMPKTGMPSYISWERSMSSNFSFQLAIFILLKAKAGLCPDLVSRLEEGFNPPPKESCSITI